MRSFKLKVCPYKSNRRSGRTDTVYEVWDGGVILAAWHENAPIRITEAHVREVDGGYACDKFREPTEPKVGVIGIARID